MSAPLRVAYVINSLERGGAQSLLVDFLKRIDRKKIEPSVVILKKRNEITPQIQQFKIEVDCIKVSLKMPTDELKDLAKFFNKKNIQIVHAHTDTASFAARLAGIFHTSAYYISHYHSNYERRVNEDYKNLETLLGPYTDAYVGCSTTVTEFMVNQLQLNRFPLLTIMNGIDLLPYLQTTIQQNKVRDDLKIPMDCFHMVHVARLKVVKRPERIIDILAQCIRDEKPWISKFRLSYIGDGDKREELETLIKLYDSEFRKKGLPLISERIVFVGTSSEVPRWLASADAFVLLSDMEGMPISVIEALASGLPCMVSDIEPMRLVVKHGENGFLVERDHIPQGVETLSRIVEDKLSQQSMHSKAVNSAQRYSVDNYIRETMDMYDNILKSPPKMKKMGFFKRRSFLAEAQNLAKGIHEQQQAQKYVKLIPE
jgi:glycosyltransferase involved in cell wall biosynthesis